MQCTGKKTTWADKRHQQVAHDTTSACSHAHLNFSICEDSYPDLRNMQHTMYCTVHLQALGAREAIANAPRPAPNSKQQPCKYGQRSAEATPPEGIQVHALLTPTLQPQPTHAPMYLVTECAEVPAQHPSQSGAMPPTQAFVSSFASTTSLSIQGENSSVAPAETDAFNLQWTNCPRCAQIGLWQATKNCRRCIQKDQEQCWQDSNASNTTRQPCLVSTQSRGTVLVGFEMKHTTKSRGGG